MMMLAEYMRRNHPAPTDYAPPKRVGPDIIKHVQIPLAHIELARAFVLMTMIGAILLPGKWSVISGLVGNAYWLYKIR